MRNRWYHVPLLHVARGDDKKVSWLELFYDLVFVASVIQFGDLLAHDISLGGFMMFAGLFVPLWVAWTGFTFYANRFTVDDFFHRLLVFLQMFAVGAMAIAAPEVVRGRPAKFALAFALAQATVAAMYLRSWRDVPEARAYSRYWGLVFAAGAALWALSPLLPGAACYALWGAGLLAVLQAPVNKRSRALAEELPIDNAHLSERYGLLVIIVLGESFVKVLTVLASGEHPADFQYLVKGALNLLITCSIWWIYFDDVAGSRIRPQRGAWVVWLYSHIPLTLSVTAVAVAVKQALTFDFAEVAPDASRWLLAGSVSLTFLSVAVTDSVTERRQAELADRLRVNVRFASGVLVLLLGQAGGAMSAGLLMALVTAVCVGQVVFDMMMAPLEAVEHGDRPITTAELARLRAAGTVEARTARPQGGLEPIRKGTPAELRRDLYFFLMEGPWSRFFLVLVFLYIISNVFFAAVFLLQPGAVSGAHGTFADAFFFSVETMSTIGYGVMSPASGYGHVVVTIEAAVGLLGVALATGLMVAKASRPRTSVLFSNVMVLITRHGTPTLTFRAGNARGNEVVDATVTLTLLREEISPEGHHLRRLHDLALVRDRSPVFTLSWTVMHEIDAKSPLHGIDWSHPERHMVSLIATLVGHDSTYGQTTYARRSYYPEDIRVGARFVDVISELPDGRLMIDYDRFHDTVEDDP